LFALAAVREDMPQLLLAVVFRVVYADYIRRVEPVPWIFFFVSLVFLAVSSVYFIIIIIIIIYDTLFALSGQSCVL